MLWTLVLGLGAILGLGVMPAIGVSMLRKRKRILQTPLTKAHALQPGMVACKGTVKPLIPTTSPFSGVDCVYYECNAERMRINDKGRVEKIWDELYGGKTEFPFYLEDETGRVMVDPNGAHLDLDNDHVYEFENHDVVGQRITSRPLQGQILETFEREGVVHTENGDPVPVRCKETFLETGTQVYLIGQCSKEAHEILRVVSPVEESLTEPVDRVILGSGEGVEQLYLSPGDEQSVPRELMSAAAWTLGIGTVVGALCVVGLVLTYA
ncbi:MAG: GIDE domain-containing protein [Planctomycetota bacterium]